MIGRRSVVGLTLLSAFLVCAFAAQSASALVVTTSKNTTAHTCIPEPLGKGDFKDEHCDETDTNKLGKFTHKLIPVGETTSIDGTNAKTAAGTTASTPAILTGTIALAKVEIECTTAKNNTANSWIRNAEPAVGQHTFEGFVETEFSTCNVKKLTKCVVKEPIVSKATVHGVEGMEGPKEEKNAMGIKFTGEGAEEKFTSIEFLNKGAEACSLNKQVFPVTGNVVATNGPTAVSKQDNKESGATLTFADLTGKVKMQTLKLGPNAASFTAIATPFMTGEPTKPISMTTTT